MIKKKHLIFLIIVIFGIPFLVNIIVTIPTALGLFIGADSSDWLVFWATNFGSFAMFFITWQTLKQNREQLPQMQNGWESEILPHLFTSIQVNS